LEARGYYVAYFCSYLDSVLTEVSRILSAILLNLIKWFNLKSVNPAGLEMWL
jgi:formylmethanofuran dehydrogenase subunit A